MLIVHEIFMLPFVKIATCIYNMRRKLIFHFRFQRRKTFMKIIGILTYWNIPNYGAFLQAYALQQVVQDMTPYD